MRAHHIQEFNKGIQHITEALWALYILIQRDKISDLNDTLKIFKTAYTEFYKVLLGRPGFDTITHSNIGFNHDFQEGLFFYTQLINKIYYSPNDLCEKFPNFMISDFTTDICDAKKLVSLICMLTDHKSELKDTSLNEENIPTISKLDESAASRRLLQASLSSHLIMNPPKEEPSLSCCIC